MLCRLEIGSASAVVPWLAVLVMAAVSPACGGDDDDGIQGVSGSGAGGGSSAGTNAGGAPTAGMGAGPSGGATSSGSGGQIAGGGAGSPGSAGASTGGAATGGTGGTSTTGGAGTTGGTFGKDAQGVCARWKADRANMSEGTWSGNVASCDPGDISAEGRANALRLFNLYRWLADLPPVVTAPDRDRAAQACALMMDAEGDLSHEPGMDWACWTQVGADGASSSNISSGPGVSSVEAYMFDGGGNASTFGHRRIVLSNQLGPIGLGSTGPGGASCMQNLRGTGDANKPWVAWPAAGVFPLQAYASGRTSLTQAGWHVQSEDISLTGAEVTISSGGMNLAVTVSALTGRYGNSSAVRFVPNGWEPMAGQTYAVSVTGIATPINYEIQFVNCN